MYKSYESKHGIWDFEVGEGNDKNYKDYAFGLKLSTVNSLLDPIHTKADTSVCSCSRILFQDVYYDAVLRFL